MLDQSRSGFADTLAALRAAGEATRLRLLVLLAEGDLTVTDMIDILGQSQPRISRHLKLLVDAGLLERWQEGAWAWFRLRDEAHGAGLARLLLGRLDRDDPTLRADRDRLAAVRARRAAQAARYFAANADDWAALRSLHVDDARVEPVLRALVGEGQGRAMLDLGTGTGRMLELFAPHHERAVGLDTSREMLAIARARLEAAGLSRIQLRQGDIAALPDSATGFDLVTIYQVLHYLDDPATVLARAADALVPGGRLIVADLAPHALEALRESHQHRRLGFGHGEITAWAEGAGLAVEAIRDIEPAEGERLTVTLWLARKPPEPSQRNSGSPS